MASSPEERHKDEYDEDDTPVLVSLESESEKLQQNNINNLGQEFPPCPVTILSGFLGSGKTTLVQYILKSPHHGKRIAVIENEFGEGLSIESLIAKDGTTETNNSLMDLIELPNGCICCTVKDSLILTLENLLQKRSDLDYILIECSGLANPGPIASLFWLDDALESRLQLDGIVTLVDAKNIIQQLAETEEAAQQIAYADRILVNKTDLISSENSALSPSNTTSVQNIVQMVRQINSTAQIRLTTFSNVSDLTWILDTKCFDADRVIQVEKEFDLLEEISHNKLSHSYAHTHDHHDSASCLTCSQQQMQQHSHTKSISTIALVENGTVDLQKVNKWLASLLWPNQDEQKEEVLREKTKEINVESSTITGPELFRIKGILSVRMDQTEADYSDTDADTSTGIDLRRFIVQAVHDLWEIHPASYNLQWLPSETRQCKIIFIGKNLDESQLRSGLQSCLLT